MRKKYKSAEAFLPLKKTLCTKRRLILWSADDFQIVKRRVKGGIVPLRPNVGFGDCRLSGLRLLELSTA